MTPMEAMGNESRRKILSLISKNGEMTALQILEEFDFSPPALSRHLSNLNEAGLISSRRQGNQHYFYLSDKSNSSIEKEIEKIFGDTFEIRLNKIISDKQQDKEKLK